MVAQKEGVVYANLRAALAKEGALIDGVAIVEHADNDRGLVATRRLEPGHVLLRLPASLLVTERRARACPITGAIMDAVKADSLSDRLPDVDGADAAITLYIFRELAKDSSPLSSWFATLPSHFHTPLTADEDDIYEHLSGTTVLYLAERLRTELREMYDEWIVPYAMAAYPDEFPAEKCTYQHFLYATSIFDSRAFRVNEGTVLAPFADMANHRVLNTPGVNVRVRDWEVHNEDERGMELYISSPDPVPAGTELCISYGAFANGQLLMHYGFAMRNNPVDTFQMTLAVPDTDSVHVQTKKMILLNIDSTGLLSLNHDLTIDNPLPPGLLATTRLLVMDEQELSPVNIHNADFSNKISEHNQASVVENLLTILRNILDDYPVIGETTKAVDDAGSFKYFARIYVESNIAIIRSAINKLKSL